jgi:hypothetical protein
VDLRTSKLIVLLFAATAATVTLVAYFGYVRYVRDVVRIGLEADPGERVPPSSLSSRRLRPARSGLRDVSVEEQMRKFEQLRMLLDRKTAQLEQQRAQLARTATENRQLQDEVDRYLTLLVQLLTEDLQTPSDSQASTPTSQTAASAEPPELSGADLEMQLGALNWALEQAQAQIAVLQESLVRQGRQTELATEAVVEAGAAAAPVLVTLLADDDPTVRQWAATILGQIGPAAVPATDALTLLLEDEDAAVREAAANSLRQIDQRP